MDLHTVNTQDLVEELLKREDLVRQDGLLASSLYRLRCELGVVATVDGVAIRETGDSVEALAIIRNTGPYAGKLCTVGGVIARSESVEQALRRQFRTDLGCEVELLSPWYKPVLLSQHRNPMFGYDPDFLPEPTKNHCVTPIYLVHILGEKINYGSTDFGQEVRGLYWFPLHLIPPEDAFGYGHHRVFRYCLERYGLERKLNSTSVVF